MDSELPDLFLGYPSSIWCDQIEGIAWFNPALMWWIRGGLEAFTNKGVLTSKYGNKSKCFQLNVWKFSL